MMKGETVSVPLLLAGQILIGALFGWQSGVWLYFCW